MFDGLKIPRAHAEDFSGSEELTESIRSDFASDIARFGQSNFSLIINLIIILHHDFLNSTITEDDVTSAYSDAPFELMEGTIYPELHAPPRPGFDIRTKVKREERSFSPVSSKASTESELILAAQASFIKGKNACENLEK